MSDPFNPFDESRAEVSPDCSTLGAVHLRIVSSLIFIGLLFCPTLPAQTKAATRDTFSSVAAKADSARDAERLDEAVILYHKALTLRPTWAKGWWSLGTIEYDRDRFEPAARAFAQLAKLELSNGTAKMMLGLCEFELGQDAISLKHIQQGKALGVIKDDALRNVAFFHEAVLLQRAEKFESSAEILRELCKAGVQGPNIDVALGLAGLLRANKTPPQSGSPDADVVSRVGRAECLAGQKKYDDARPLFDAVVKQYPNFPNVHYAYALFLMEIRDVDAGVRQFKQEIANNPNHVLARLRIAASLYKQDSAAGLPFAEEAVKLAPQMGFAHYLFGLLLLDTNNYDRAIPELETAQKSFSKEPKLYFALGSAYSRAGRKQDAARARATFERLTKEAASSPSTTGEIGIGAIRGEKENPQSPE